MSSLFPTYARWDIEPESAKGLWLTSTDGTKYLDFTSGIGVLNLGHCPDKVKSAVSNQLEKYWHVSNMFKSSAQERTAKALTDVTGLGRVFFANSGAEANEGAIKLARKATGRSKLSLACNPFMVVRLLRWRQQAKKKLRPVMEPCYQHLNIFLITIMKH